MRAAAGADRGPAGEGTVRLAAAVFLGAGRRAGAFRAVDAFRPAAVFRVAVFRAAVFRAAVFRAAFLAVPLRAAAFRAPPRRVLAAFRALELFRREALAARAGCRFALDRRAVRVLARFRLAGRFLFAFAVLVLRLAELAAERRVVDFAIPLVLSGQG